jgi:hypothetical protein
MLSRHTGARCPPRRASRVDERKGAGVNTNTAQANGARTLPPQGWRGETDCVIGPFENRHAALVYVTQRVDFGRGDVLERVFPRGGEWFVELSRLTL